MDNFEFRSDWWGKSKREKESAEAFVRRWNENLASLSENP